MVTDRIFFPLLARREQYSVHEEYTGYRQEIREDCRGRCVYCDLHENEIGGSDEMTLDHFRPRAHYSHLIHDPNNLVLACRGCNVLKGSFWPARGGLGTFVGSQGFIDPFSEDRLDYFEVLQTGELRALRNPAQSMIDHLLLNRQGVKALREKRSVKYQSKQITERYFDEEIAVIDSLLQEEAITDEERILLLEDRRSLENQKEMIYMQFFDFTLYEIDNKH